MANKAVSDKQKVLDDLNANHEQRLVSVMEDLQAQILASLNALQVSGGNLVSSEVNLQIALDQRTELLRIFNENYNNDFVTPTVKDFDQVLVANKDYFRALDNSVPITALDVKILNNLKAGASATLTNLGVETQIRIADLLYTSTLTGANFSETIKEVENILTGLEDRRGTPMEVHAKTIAHDSLVTTDRTINFKKSEDAGFTKYLYFGSLVQGTRDFCKRFVGQVKTKAEWDAVGMMDWVGKKTGDLFTDAGGWNCGHQLVGVE
jgi:hypothetical protein